MIRQVATYVAVCDRCGEQHDGGDYVGWTDAESAHTMALESEWKQIGTRLVCWNCWGYGIDGETIVERTP